MKRGWCLLLRRTLCKSRFRFLSQDLVLSFKVGKSSFQAEHTTLAQDWSFLAKFREIYKNATIILLRARKY